MPDVRSIFITLLLSLAAPLIAADLPSPSQSFENTSLPPPRERVEIRIDEFVSRHSSRGRFYEICRSDKKLLGCTEFPDETISCECRLSSNGWSVKAKVRILAHIHVKTGDLSTLEHERRHIEDLRQSLNDHLIEILSLDYPSRDACRHLARIISSPSYLRPVMDRLRLESNRKFGCS